MQQQGLQVCTMERKPLHGCTIKKDDKADSSNTSEGWQMQAEEMQIGENRKDL